MEVAVVKPAISDIFSLKYLNALRLKLYKTNVNQLVHITRNMDR